jgi:hypothetical protein
MGNPLWQSNEAIQPKRFQQRAYPEPKHRATEPHQPRGGADPNIGAAPPQQYIPSNDSSRSCPACVHDAINHRD